MFIRRADLDHCHIARQGAAAVEFLCLAKEDRNIVCISGLNSLADVASNEESLVEEHSVVFRIGVWCRALCVQVVDAHVTELTCVASAA